MQSLIELCAMILCLWLVPRILFPVVPDVGLIPLLVTLLLASA